MYKFSLYLLLILIISNTIQGLTTSVVIPCHQKHVKFIPDLLNAYEKQTLKPQEVIISISERKEKLPFLEKFLNRNRFSFETKILYNQEKLLAGPNRNRGCSEASNDIIILQDADDLPHPQRVEIITYFFDNFNYDLLIHSWADSQKRFNDTNLNRGFSIDEICQINTARFFSIKEVFASGHFTFGNLAIRRNIFNIINWPNIYPGEDQFFVKKALDSQFNCGLIFSVLLDYRIHLSAGND